MGWLPTDYNGTTSFGFDGWGRMTSKSRSSYSATYGYKYGQMLCSVTSNFPGEGNVTYNYGGNFQRRERTANSITTKFNWNGGLGLISEEDKSGNLTSSYTGRLADVAGSNPSSGSYRYYHGDNLGSARLVTNGTSDTLATNEYTPYGGALVATGSSTMWSFAMLANDSQSELLLAPYRSYDSVFARWTTRDPLGALNSYGYVYGNPICLIDPLGLDALDNAASFFGGMGDALTFGGTGAIRRWMGTDNFVDQCSWWYTGGEGAGVALGAGLGAGAAARITSGAWNFSGRFGGFGFKFAGNHGPHHSFAPGLKLPHAQLNWWRPGVSGSGGAMRLPYGMPITVFALPGEGGCN